jgi:hypothetical protein
MMSDIKIDLTISLHNLESEFMKTFKDKGDWIVLDFYNSATISLCHKGLLATTDLRKKDGVKTDKSFLYMTELGKEVYNKIKVDEKFKPKQR